MKKITNIFVFTILLIGMFFCTKSDKEKTEQSVVRKTDAVQAKTDTNITTVPCGSRSGDSLALIALKRSGHMYRGTEKNAWDSTTPMEQWNGIYTKDGRVDSIYFSSVECKELPVEIKSFTALTYFNVSDNFLVQLPKEIGALTNLRNLNCAHQFYGSDWLKTLPDEIGNLRRLEVLCCDNNSLQSIPSDIGNCTNLKELFIDRNELKTLPSSIGKLRNLSILMAWANQLTSIPPEIGNCTALKYLNIGANALSKIPEEIAELKQLEVLDVSNNDTNLSEIPPAIFSLPKLTNLNLSENTISRIPQEIGRGVNLDTLYINNNHLTSLPEEITSLTKLTCLDAGHNDIEEANISRKTVAFLDKFDPDWRLTQNIEHSTFEPAIDPLDTTGIADHLEIVPPDSEPYLYNIIDLPPQAGHYYALYGNVLSESRLDTASITAEKDSIDDFYNGRVAGWIVHTDWKKELLMYMRGIPELKTGPVKTLYINERWSHKKPFPEYSYPLQKKQFSKSFPIQGIGSFSMKASANPQCNTTCEGIGSIQWSVRFGEGEWWKLPVVEGNTSDPIWATADDAILWIGDLDNDNKPDIIMSPMLGPVERYRYYEVFLSTAQNPGHLWKVSANFSHYPPTTGD